METEHPNQVDPTGQRVTPPPTATAEAEHALKNGQPGLGTAAKNFADHLSALVRLEIELAQLEINRKVSLIAKGLIMAGDRGPAPALPDRVRTGRGRRRDRDAAARLGLAL